MKLYLVKRTDSVGYEQIESMVIAAEDAETAMNTHPDSDMFRLEFKLVKDSWYFHSDGKDIKDRTWASPRFLVAKEIGETDKYDKTTVIHVSSTGA